MTQISRPKKKKHDLNTIRCLATFHNYKSFHMAEIAPVKGKKSAPRIDFTPMVDLGFLLITFFIFTTSLSEPRNIEMRMPAEGYPPTELPHHIVMTILIGAKHQLFYYSGEDALHERLTKLKKCNFSQDGIRMALMDHSRQVKQAIDQGLKGSTVHDVPFVIIKASKQADYSDLVNLLDELMISNIQQYALLDINRAEETAIMQPSTN